MNYNDENNITLIYNFKDSKLIKVFHVCLLFFVVLLSIGRFIGVFDYEFHKYTYENYERISYGMSYSDVCNILEDEGELEDVYQLGVLVVWKNNYGKEEVRVFFVNERVFFKTQENLKKIGMFS